jgi:hypothetical protein
VTCASAALVTPPIFTASANMTPPLRNPQKRGSAVELTRAEMQLIKGEIKCPEGLRMIIFLFLECDFDLIISSNSI